MKPFDLERALAGDPVVTRDGRLVTQLTLFDAKRDAYSLVGTLLGEVVMSWTTDGHRTEGYITPYDLFMAPKTQKRWVVIETHGNGSESLVGIFREKHLAVTAWSAWKSRGHTAHTFPIEWSE